MVGVTFTICVNGAETALWYVASPPYDPVSTCDPTLNPARLNDATPPCTARARERLAVLHERHGAGGIGRRWETVIGMDAPQRAGFGGS